jgi:hypothetical protein
MSKSMTRSFLGAGGALGAALILAILLVSGRQTAHAVTGITDPTPGSIYQVSVDTNITGNAPGTGDGALLGPVDPVVGVALGGTQTIDVIIDEIAVPDGLMTAFQFNLVYNQAVVNVTAESALPYMVGAGASQVQPTCPTGPGCLAHANTTGNLLLEWAHFDGTGVHYGEGILVELTLQCVGTSAGSSPLTLTDTVVGGQGPGTVRIYTTVGPGGDPSAQYPVANVNSGTINCGGTGSVTASPTATTTGSVTASPTATATGSVTASPTATATGSVTASPTATTTGSVTASPTATATATPTQTPTATPTQTPTATPTQTPTATPTQTPTATPTPSATTAHTPTPTATPNPSGTAAAATTAHISGTRTPAALPKTGGPSSDSSSTTTLLLLLALGAVLVLTASGSVVYARVRRRE